MVSLLNFVEFEMPQQTVDDTENRGKGLKEVRSVFVAPVANDDLLDAGAGPH